MAAINFGLALREGDTVVKDRDLPPDEAAFLDCYDPAQGLGSLAGKACRTPDEILASTHANLTRMAVARGTILEALQGVTFHVEGKRGSRGSTVYDIVYEEPLPLDAGLPFGLLPPSAAKRVGILTWTSKMGAPSYSLPAGAPAVGGTCPAAAGAQSTTDSRAVGRRALTILREYAPEKGATQVGADVDVPAAVCQHCYATTGNYTMYASMLTQQMITLAWTDAAMRDGSFVPTMVAAIDQADYKLDGSGKKTVPEPAHWRQTGWRFFRIHDSGDFYDKDYFLAWKAIADAFAPGNPYGHQPVMFWAPTRMWAVGTKTNPHDWIDFVNDVNGGENNLGNFIIRPSAYELNQHAPDLYRPGGGWAAGSTVFSPEAAREVRACDRPATFDWDCRAYEVKKGPTCREAENPQGKKGCRACWVAPQAVVNYQAHGN